MQDNLLNLLFLVLIGTAEKMQKIHVTKDVTLEQIIYLKAT